MFVNRIYSSRLQELVCPGKVLLVYGPRQVGKTTLIREFLTTYKGRVFQTTGEDSRTRTVLSAMSQETIRLNYGNLDLLFIDEAQAIPGIGQVLKLVVDTLPNLAVIVTGSSSFTLAGETGEPLVGRKRTLTLYPFSFGELREHVGFAAADAMLDTLLVYGSYPDVFLQTTVAEKRNVLTELAESYLYKDIIAFESLRNSEKIRKLLMLIAFQVGKDVSLTELGMQLGLSRQTVERYLDLLEKCFVVYRVGGFSRNLRSEITKTSRWYFFDNGILNAVTGQFADCGLRADQGLLWENWIMSERLKHLVYSDLPARRYFWRTYNQVEINSIEEAYVRLAAWEFKAGGKQPKCPASWSAAYPEASWGVVNRENYASFI